MELRNNDNAGLETLQTELDFYRQNQTVVEREIRTLIEDNQTLSHQVGTLLKEKMENARENITHGDQNKENEDLRTQVAFLMKERDSLHVLWQTSQKTIDALETELKAYQGCDGRSKQTDKEERRDLELKLETALADYVELESKYKKLQFKFNALENDNKIKMKDIVSYKERGKEFEAKVEELNKTLQEYKIELSAEKKNNEDTKNQLALCQKECVDLVKKEAEAKSKVAEALQLFDLVSSQKNEAFRKIAEITGELMLIKQTLANVKRETEADYKGELDSVKDKYNEKVADMLEHIRNLDAELVEKGLLLNKAMRENKILQATNDKLSKQQKDAVDSIDPKLALAEQRLEAIFQELMASEKRNMQLVCEKQCLVMNMNRVQEEHVREIKRRDWEESLLKSQCEELRMQVENLRKSLDETHALVGKLQTMLTSRTELSQKMLSTKEEELSELNKHLENQMELSKKENKILQATNDKLSKQQKDAVDSIDPKLALAEQRLEAIFQELMASEKRNMQLVCEKQCLVMNMNRVQEEHVREIKRRDWEESLLKSQCEELRMQVENLRKSLDETHALVGKLQTMLTSRTELSQKMLSTKEEELSELNKHLENQMELSKKWKESYMEMNEKLKRRLEALQNENKELRIQLKMPFLGSSVEGSSDS